MSDSRGTRFFAFGSCVLVLVVFQTLLTKTKIGLAFRAVSSNLESSRLSGIKKSVQRFSSVGH